MTYIQRNPKQEALSKQKSTKQEQSVETFKLIESAVALAQIHFVFFSWFFFWRAVVGLCVTLPSIKNSQNHVIWPICCWLASSGTFFFPVYLLYMPQNEDSIYIYLFCSSSLPHSAFPARAVVGWGPSSFWFQVKTSGGNRFPVVGDLTNRIIT